MPIAFKSKLAKAPAIALAISTSLALTACGGMPENGSVYSTKQPVVERTNYVLDVKTSADGLSFAEQRRLADWFETMDLRFGDRVSIDDPMASAATYDAINQIAGRDGIIVSRGAPVTEGIVPAGQARVVITRSLASVPGCPDWSVKSEMNYTNGTHPGHGCAINGNLAAMVANPEDLITGQKGTGETVVMSSTKAIRSYRSDKSE
ncbi:CpaD family pilus assembly protein [Qipengyuania oceanensis]|uniref:Pilus assembly protein CpaD n=1 Tax=Qipengyuania oceanensis TaxID=1463597 RepID=A0A844YER0_9SPHN|nr:CpaD family pilus assembly protein [Qipengyuania oceanensis]MXO62432.1 pilus assembly protein CpaD [Qipengyuania oceanensis]